MIAKSETLQRPTASVSEQNLKLTFALARAAIANPTILDEIPDGAFVVLLPGDSDPAFIEENIALGLAALREGRDVYFRHLGPDEFAVPDDSSIGGSWDDHVVKRERPNSRADEDFQGAGAVR